MLKKSLKFLLRLVLMVVSASGLVFWILPWIVVMLLLLVVEVVDKMVL